MKNLLLIIGMFFILVGCTPKQEVVIPKQKVVRETKPTSSMDNKVEEVIEEEVIKPKLEDGLNKIAIIYPSKIVSKYAKSTVSTVTAYLLEKNKAFEIETFDTYTENSENILKELDNIDDKGYTKVIALFTEKGFDILNSQNINSMKIYFPLINKKEIQTTNKNFIFGGISYAEQIELLKTFSSNKTTMFYVKSYIGDKLKTYTQNTFESNLLTKEVKRHNNRYKHIIEDKRIKGSTILLNTPIIKSSIIMSQITAYEIEPAIILSTQLNYNPLLIKLTQSRDRTNFFIANSIGKVDEKLTDNISTLDGDISYNWVDYSSLIGADYLLNNSNSSILNLLTSSDENEERIVKLIDSKVEDNQVVYTPKLYRSTSYGFELALSEEEN